MIFSMKLIEFFFFLFFSLWPCDPTRVMAFSFLRFLDHTRRRTTVGRTPLDEWSARRRDLYLTAHNTHNRQISIPPGGIRIHDLSRRAAPDLRLRTRGHWERLYSWITAIISHLYLQKRILFMLMNKTTCCYSLDGDVLVFIGTCVCVCVCIHSSGHVIPSRVHLHISKPVSFSLSNLPCVCVFRFAFASRLLLRCCGQNRKYQNFQVVK